MTTATEPRATHSGAAGRPDRRRWLALIVIAVSQLMVVLDATIVNIALPHAQAALHISDTDRQWVVTAYTLAFGGLLLLGGRIADYGGRKRAFMVGIVGFAAASALGGAATAGWMLYAARALQGAFGALLAPAALALLTVTFTEPRERAKAFGVYGAIAGGGSAVGLVLGGVLTEYLNWRWCLFVNIPIALLTAVAALVLLRESKASGNTKYDVPGAVLVTGGLVALVYGFTKASQDGWSAPVTLGLIAGAVALLAAFVAVERRSANPLLPLRIAGDRTRGGSFLVSTLTGAALLGAFLFLTYYFQVVLTYSPVVAGVASLPVTVGVLVAAGLATNLLPRVGPKPIMVVGAVASAVAMFLLTAIGVDTSYWTHVLGPILLLGFGLGMVFVPVANTALVGVAPHDAGAASALVNATQQVGGSLGTALLNTLYATAVTGYLAGHGATAAVRPHALVHGYTVAFAWAGAILAVAAVIILVFVRGGKDHFSGDDAVAPVVHVG